MTRAFAGQRPARNHSVELHRSARASLGSFSRQLLCRCLHLCKVYRMTALMEKVDSGEYDLAYSMSRTSTLRSCSCWSLKRQRSGRSMRGGRARSKSKRRCEQIPSYQNNSACSIATFSNRLAGTGACNLALGRAGTHKAAVITAHVREARQCLHVPKPERRWSVCNPDCDAGK